jgi:ribosomal protein S1
MFMERSRLISVGDVIDVVITKIEDRGVYVSYQELIGFIDAIHLSWVSYRNQAHRFYQVGEQLTVKVLFVKPTMFYDFAASLRDITPLNNPWLYSELFAVGTRLEATVRQGFDFGYYMYLGFGLTANMPIENARRVLNVGEFVAVKIVSVNVRKSFPTKIIVEMLEYGS